LWLLNRFEPFEDRAELVTQRGLVGQVGQHDVVGPVGAHDSASSPPALIASSLSATGATAITSSPSFSLTTRTPFEPRPTSRMVSPAMRTSCPLREMTMISSPS